MELKGKGKIKTNADKLAGKINEQMMGARRIALDFGNISK